MRRWLESNGWQDCQCHGQLRSSFGRKLSKTLSGTKADRGINSLAAHDMEGGIRCLHLHATWSMTEAVPQATACWALPVKDVEPKPVEQQQLKQQRLSEMSQQAQPVEDVNPKPVVHPVKRSIPIGVEMSQQASQWRLLVLPLIRHL